jgi:hypothetical protein
MKGQYSKTDGRKDVIPWRQQSSVFLLGWTSVHILNASGLKESEIDESRDQGSRSGVIKKKQILALQFPPPGLSARFSLPCNQESSSSVSQLETV